MRTVPRRWSPRRSPGSSPAGSASRRRDPTGGPAVWAGIVGQPAALALLQRAIAQDRLAHAYAFVGPSGVGRRLTAVAFAQAALCPAQGCGACATCRRVAAGQFPDCQFLAPTPPRENPKGTPTIRIEQIRELERTAALAPLEGAPQGVRRGRRRAHDAPDRAGAPQDPGGAAAPDPPGADRREPACLAADGPLALPARAVRAARRGRRRPAPRGRGESRRRRAQCSRAWPQGRPGLALATDLDAAPGPPAGGARAGGGAPDAAGRRARRGAHRPADGGDATSSSTGRGTGMRSASRRAGLRRCSSTPTRKSRSARWRPACRSRP